MINLNQNHTSYPIKAIIDTDAQAVHETNADGKLPLHFAAWHQCDHSIIALLLTAHPLYARAKEAKGGNLPLHYAIQYAPQGEGADVRPAMLLLEAYPAGVFEPNAKGLFPIHLAAKGRCPMRLLDALLKICPYSVGYEDLNPHSRLLPLDYALLANHSVPGFATVSRLLGVDLRPPPTGAASGMCETSLVPSAVASPGSPASPRAAGLGHKTPPSFSPASLPALPAHSPSRGHAASPSASHPFPTSPFPSHLERDALSAVSTPDPDADTDQEHRQVGVKEALLDLQRNYREQGEALRMLRKKHADQTMRLQKELQKQSDLRHDISWRDDRIRILDKELEILRRELESYK